MKRLTVAAGFLIVVALSLFSESAIKGRVVVKSSCSYKLQNTVAQLQSEKNRCRILEHILRYGNISPMSNIIEEYKSMSNFYLQQLIKEVEIYRSSSVERSQLLDFVHYPRSVTSEIEDILIVEH